MSEPGNDTVASAEESPRPRRRWWLWAMGALVLLIFLLAGSVWWVLNTQSGTRFAVNRVVGFLAGKLEIAQVEGTIAGPLTASGIRFVNPESGVDVRVGRVAVDVAL